MRRRSSRIRALCVCLLATCPVAACGNAAAPDAGDASVAPDVPSGTDAPVGVDITNEAGALCTSSSPVGPGVTGLTVEGCTFEHGAVGVASDGDLRAITLEPGGNTLYIAYGPTGHTSVDRFVDDTAAGCHFHRDTAWVSPLPASETALYADVAVDGSVYVASSSVVAWTIGRNGTCGATAGGLGQRLSMQVGSDFHLVAPDGVGVARLLDTTSCAYADSTFGPNPAMGAARVGTDYVFVSGANHVERYDPSGTRRWIGTATLNAGTEIRPCGADVCVFEAGATPAIARMSGIDGSRVATYDAAQLFGATFGGNVRLDACPGGSTFAMAWVGAPDPTCAPENGQARAVDVVRIRGF